jgi:hypothetical protein
LQITLPTLEYSGMLVFVFFALLINGKLFHFSWRLLSISLALF